MSVRRPLRDVLEVVVRQAALALDASDGFLVVAGDGDRPTSAGIGAWKDEAPPEVEDAVRESGRAVVVAGLLAVPVRVGAEVAGVLAVGRGASGGRPFAGDAAELLARFAQVAAIAHGNERLFATERAAREQAQALRAATEALSATLDLPEVLAAILSELHEVVPYDTASVQELQGERMVIIGG
ncbi:MAG TPA: hypothetical protein VFQ51_11120, partial [Vicinamibacteria bacterium]|nr:hypothetical protein [Vicinamibacteria bacterium]